MWNSIRNILSRRKPFIEYEFKEVAFNLREEGKVKYAQWLHPGEFGNEVTQIDVDFFKKYIKKGDFIVDIGAHEGDTTVPMALAAGSEGLTLGLEPNPNVFKVLQVNANLNRDKTNIIPLNFAATPDDGEFTFGSGDPSYGNGGIIGFTYNEKRNTRYTFQVTGKNLQNYLRSNYPNQLDKLTFIKIDTEGYDKEIIKAISELIDKYRPYLVTECFGPALKIEKQELFDLLNTRRYFLYPLDGFKEASKNRITRDSIAEKRTYNILAIPIEKA